jgi:hypothetical protein
LKSQTQRTKTITRTFRLDEKINKTLEEEAAKEKITVNSLVSQILWNYKTRCQYCLHYNLLLVEPTILKTILDSMPEEAVGKFGSELGPSVVKENLARLGMKQDKETVEAVIVKALGKWARWYDADVSETNQGRVFYLHHVLGKKWSVFLKNFLEKVITELMDLNVNIETTENSVIFNLPSITKPFKPL